MTRLPHQDLIEKQEACPRFRCFQMIFLQRGRSNSARAEQRSARPMTSSVESPQVAGEDDPFLLVGTPDSTGRPEAVAVAPSTLICNGAMRVDAHQMIGMPKR